MQLIEKEIGDNLFLVCCCIVAGILSPSTARVYLSKNKRGYCKSGGYCEKCIFKVFDPTLFNVRISKTIPMYIQLINTRISWIISWGIKPRFTLSYTVDRGFWFPTYTVLKSRITTYSSSFIILSWCLFLIFTWYLLFLLLLYYSQILYGSFRTRIVDLVFSVTKRCWDEAR
jgi:hypothetical protein